MILVTVTIAVLSTIGVRTYYAERDRFIFNDSLTRILSLIKTARTYALTSFPVAKGGQTQILPIDGYGVHIKLDTMPGKSILTVFANLGPQADDQKDDQPDKFDASDLNLETYTIPSQIRFKYFWFDGVKKWTEDAEAPENSGPSAAEAVMIFKPPLGEMFIGDNASLSLNELALELTNPEAEKGSPKECQRIAISRIKRFPELAYERCP